MKNSQGIGLIEVLVSASIFLLLIANITGFITRMLIHAKQTEQLQSAVQMIVDLNEQLYVVQKYKISEEQQLIALWQRNFHIKIPNYSINIITQSLNLQIVINQREFTMVFDVFGQGYL